MEVCISLPCMALALAHHGRLCTVQKQFVKDTRRLFRTDFFPGLGWMLRRQLWEQELR